MSFDINQFYKQLDEKFKNNDKDILNFFEEKIKEVIDLESKEGYIVVANEKASFHRVRGETKEAYDLYQNSLSLLDRDKKLQKAIILVNLGDVYMVDKNYRMALETFNQALEIVDDLEVKDERLYASIYNNRSAAYRNLSLYKEAIKDIKEAISLMSKDSKDGSRWATSLINLSELYIMTGEISRAEDCIDRSIAFFKSFHEGNDIHYANALATKANICYLNGIYDKSYYYYSKAVELFEKKTGKSKMLDMLIANKNKVYTLIRSYK